METKLHLLKHCNAGNHKIGAMLMGLLPHPPLDPHPGGPQNDGKTGLRAETQIYDDALSSYEQKSEELCTTSGLILKKKTPLTRLSKHYELIV